MWPSWWHCWPPARERLADCYGVGNARGPRLPLVLVPTTAGTGSEVTPISIITTGAHTKMGVVSPVILPDVALLDADLTLSVPPSVTAATGIDAMVHAIEAYTSGNVNNNPLSRMLAREALRLLGGAIRTARHQGYRQGCPRRHAAGGDARRTGLCQFTRGRRPCAGPIRSADIMACRMD